MLPLILLVDDEEEILDFLERILSPRYSIVRAGNGQEALEVLNQYSVQLIICDIMMPKMNGFDFCKTVKSHFDHSHIPVILLTAKSTIQSKVKGLELSADAYIEKPFSKEYLFAQIASLLSNRNIIREYFASSPMVHIKTMAHSKTDEIFLETLHKTISDHMEDTQMDVEELAAMMNMTRITLYRKIKAISNLSPSELIHIIRLKKAAELLSGGDNKIYEISAIVGYSSQSNLSRNFIKYFNMTPSEYMQSQNSRAKKQL